MSTGRSVSDEVFPGMAENCISEVLKSDNVSKVVLLVPASLHACAMT